VRSLWAAEASQIGQSSSGRRHPIRRRTTHRIADRRLARCRNMVFTGAVLPPQTLASWGLINRVVPADSLTRRAALSPRISRTVPRVRTPSPSACLHAWRSGGVAAADAVTRAEGRNIIMSEDLRDGSQRLRAMASAAPPSTTDNVGPTPVCRHPPRDRGHRVMTGGETCPPPGWRHQEPQSPQEPACSDRQQPGIRTPTVKTTPTPRTGSCSSIHAESPPTRDLLTKPD